jgi:hypothetical protein
MPSHLEASQFHPEFGYFAPTMRFRRKVSLTLIGALWGVLIGAGAVLYAAMEREERAHAMLASPVLATPIAAPPASAPSMSPTSTQPVSASQISPPPAAKSARVAAVPSSTLPSKTAFSTPASPIAPRAAASKGITPVPFVPESIALPMAAPHDPPIRGTIASTVVAASTPAATPASAPEVKAAPKPKKKIVREPPARAAPPEPEPRSAFAGPFRALGLPFFRFGY